MKFWWVNHNRTGQEERSGGFLWSPKVSKSGSRLQSYENMTRISADEPILSYLNGRVGAVGTAKISAVEAAKPAEFGAIAEWASHGWMLPVRWTWLPQPYVPKDDIDNLRTYLPAKHYPIQPQSGLGVQAYLFEISEELFHYVSRKAGLK